MPHSNSEQQTDWLADEFAKLGTYPESGPPAHVVQATLNALDAESSGYITQRRVGQLSRKSAAGLSLAAVSIALLLAVAFVSWERPNGNGSEEVAIRSDSGRSVSTAFVENDQLDDGQLFLLPLSPHAVRVGDAKLPADMFSL